ncbi:hypothetical protein [Chryseobacterium indoltheticum]|uniref:Uncharacterized protein n=1 Tax=Chryseobacterium indoltheticum TaxID=254 RepID=A0A381FC52_9FLAO|nr:hypothetical protein [Chryseobacterium indoltheticum]AZA73808.1 hypothetical protein EG358_08605 [Chryseobacterium indoltheticum]SIQ96027.1 hypothetical protein SAMN05421682_110157 [Chryseobacterium indoltheticum]SUX44054.1 Uncharacterised protein [Chryseobacterium indoltheticum]
MNTDILPTQELKEFGIINNDNSFTQKLSAEEIQKFLQGYTIVADNNKKRATFQLVDNNNRLKVIFLERDRGISQILDASKRSIEYSTVAEVSDSGDEMNFRKKAFVFDLEHNKVVEFDLIKNSRELTAIIADKKDVEQISRYKNELEKLRSFLQDKMERYPEIAKDISRDLSVVSKEINTVDGIIRRTNDPLNTSKQNQSGIELNVNDPDRYQDAQRNREEQNEYKNEDLQRSKGYGR